MQARATTSGSGDIVEGGLETEACEVVDMVDVSPSGDASDGNEIILRIEILYVVIESLDCVFLFT